MASSWASSLLLLLLFGVALGDDPEPVFRPEGGAIEMGYCFGVDFIVIYRLSPDADQLLGNSSIDGMPPSLPTDLRDRIKMTNHQQLLGLQIRHLRRSDSGLYRRECWQDRVLVNQHRQQLSVCDKEVPSEEIHLSADGGTELLCNSTEVTRQGATVRWYYEVHPSYKATMFLDTAVSPEPLLESLQGVVEVREGGKLLAVPGSVLKDSQHFYCLVMDGQSCLSFQNIFLPDKDDVQVIFATAGERVVLDCPTNNNNQRWETPLGPINSTTESLTSASSGDEIQLTGGDMLGGTSLVIPKVSDNLAGDYSCFSPSLVTEFSLIVCPLHQPRKIEFVQGGKVKLKCKVNLEEGHSIQWHRSRAPGENSLILDSKDKSVPFPEDLRGRVVLPEENDSTLKLSDLTTKDAGEYWCLVLARSDLGFIYDYQGDEEEEDYNYEVDESGEEWPEAVKCISKQVFELTDATPPRKDEDSNFVDNKPAWTAAATPRDSGRMGPDSGSDDKESHPTDEPETSNALVYALGATLAGLVIVGVIVTVIVVLKRRKRAGSGSGAAHTETREDLECTERLKPEESNNS